MRFLMIPLLALLASCSLFKDDKPEEKPSSTAPKLVGRVASTPSGADFVLIEAYGPWKVPDGGMLAGIGNEGRTSNLAATGEKMGQYLAADVRSGVAKVGDSVYYRPMGEPAGDSAPLAPTVKGSPSSQLETQKKPEGSPAKP
jgi:hypothetical protein